MNNDPFQNALKYLQSLDCSDEDVIDGLKDIFKVDVGSTRTLHRITNLQDLIKVLGKRLLVTTVSLDTIASKLPANSYHEYKRQRSSHILSRTQTPCTSRSATTMHSNPPVQQLPLQLNNHRQKSNSTGRNVKLEKVYEMICEELGPKHWKNFARHLDIHECAIDTYLDYSHGDMKECIRKVLYRHEEESNPTLWRHGLLEALDKAKRTDLRKKVALKLDEFNIVCHNM